MKGVEFNDVIHANIWLQENLEGVSVTDIKSQAIQDIDLEVSEDEITDFDIGRSFVGAIVVTGSVLCVQT